MMTGIEKIPKPTAMHCEGDTHEIPVKPMTLDGIAWEFQDRPTLAVCKTVSTPTAKQSEVVGHETESSWLIPGGGDWLDQDNPPVVVAIIVDPAPALPLFPTAMQSLALADEMLKRSTPLEGTSVWLVQVDPLLSVPTTYGAESKLVPRATQFVIFGQKTPFSWVPKGIEVCAVQDVRFTVLTEAPPPAAPLPTATQVVDPADETAVRDDTEGEANVVHRLPFVVPTMAGTALTTPTAMQVAEVSQDTLLRELRFAGGVCISHEEPDVVVPTISVPPTAVHWLVVTQEIDSGGKDESEIVQVEPPSIDFMIPAPPPT